MKRQLIIVAVLALVGLGAAEIWHRTGTEGPTFSAPAGLEMALLPEPRALDDFQLVGPGEKPYTLDQLRGHWSVLFFGYTHCPDICPTTLATLKQFSKALDKDHPELAADTRFVFVSVDPKRDNPEQLQKYVNYFDPDFTGITGQKVGIDQLANQVGAAYLFEGDTSSEDYIVNHSATLYLIDPQGRYVARLFPPHTPDELLTKYERIRAFLAD
jgi:protein SCO1/2